MDDMSYTLPSPFKEAFKRGDSIDYKLVKGAKKTDHDIVREMGYNVKMYSDCSCGASGLPGISLSSYGDWGTIYVDDASDKVKNLFLKMCEDNIIKPWRIRAYVNHICHDYDERGWQKYDKDTNSWIKTTSPYTK